MEEHFVAMVQHIQSLEALVEEVPVQIRGTAAEGHSRRAACDKLAAQQFDTLRVCWEHLSPQSSLQPQKKWAQAFSDRTRRG